MKKLKRTYMRCALTAALVLLVMLIAGSIWDLPISKFLYPGHEAPSASSLPPSASCLRFRFWPDAAFC